MRADLHPEVAVRPVEAHAKLVLANLSDVFEGQETGRLAVPNPTHQVHKELRARETHPSLLIKAIETWQSLSRRPRTPKPPAHQLSHIRLHISQEHTLMELSYTQTHYRHTPPGHPATPDPTGTAPCSDPRRPHPWGRSRLRCPPRAGTASDRTPRPESRGYGWISRAYTPARSR